MIGIIYSVSTGRVRSLIFPSLDAELNKVTPGPGEGMLTASSKISVAAAQQLVTSATGKTPVADRYALIPNGSGVVPVAGAILADPLCGDAVNGFTMVAHPSAGKGWTYTYGLNTFIAPVLGVGV